MEGEYHHPELTQVERAKLKRYFEAVRAGEEPPKTKSSDGAGLVWSSER